MRRKKRKQSPVQVILRLYPGQDDDLIYWLDQLDEVQFGAKTQALKEALRTALGVRPSQVATGVPVLDLAEVRRVVEAGVASALGRLEGQMIAGVRTTPPEADDDEVEGLLAALQRSLVLGDDEGGANA